MSFTEVVKMLNEKGMSEVNKFVVSDVIAAINYSKRKERNVLFGIEEPLKKCPLDSDYKKLSKAY